MNDQNVLRMRTLGEITEAVPYLVGFTPEESLVAIVSDYGRVMVTARVDLADVAPDDAAESLIGRLNHRYPDSNMLFLAYTNSPSQGWDIIDRCTHQLGQDRVTAELVINNDTWTSRQGQHGTIDPYGAVAATIVSTHGLQRRNSRSRTRSRTHQPTRQRRPPPPAQHAVATMPVTRDQILNATVQTMQEGLASTGTLSAPDAFRLAALVHHRDARDTALYSITADNAAQHLQLWQHVVHTVSAEAAQPALFLAGMAAWISGDGARATIALEHLEPPSPDNPTPPGTFLASIIDQVIPPTHWDLIRAKALNRSDEAIHIAVGTFDPQLRMTQQWEQVQPATSESPDQVRNHRSPKIGPSP